MRRYVEDYPSIDMGLLKRRGLFDETGEGYIEVDLPVGTMRFTRLNGAIRIRAKDAPLSETQKIDVQTAALRFGERRYFVCPKTGARASKLYYLDGSFASREGHGLVHLVITNKPEESRRGRTANLASRLNGSALGKGPARGHRKRALIEQLVKAGDLSLVDAETRELLRREAVIAADQRIKDDRSRRDFETSTAYALFAAAHMKKPWPETEILRELNWAIEAHLDFNLDLPERIKFEPEWLYPRARLDIRTLVKEGLIVPGEIHAAALEWHKDFGGLVSYALLVADLRDEKNPFLLLELRDKFNREEHRQVIELVHASDRWYLRCPFLGGKRITLYLRQERFGSEKALNLRRKAWDFPEDDDGGNEELEAEQRAFEDREPDDSLDRAFEDLEFDMRDFRFR